MRLAPGDYLALSASLPQTPCTHKWGPKKIIALQLVSQGRGTAGLLFDYEPPAEKCCPSKSADGTTDVFASDRPTGKILSGEREREREMDRGVTVNQSYCDSYKHTQTHAGHFIKHTHI